MTSQLLLLLLFMTSLSAADDPAADEIRGRQSETAGETAARTGAVIRAPRTEIGKRNETETKRVTGAETAKVTVKVTGKETVKVTGRRLVDWTVMVKTAPTVIQPEIDREIIAEENVTEIDRKDQPQETDGRLLVWGQARRDRQTVRANNTTEPRTEGVWTGKETVKYENETRETTRTGEEQTETRPGTWTHKETEAITGRQGWAETEEGWTGNETEIRTDTRAQLTVQTGALPVNRSQTEKHSIIKSDRPIWTEETETKARIDRQTTSKARNIDGTWRTRQTEPQNETETRSIVREGNIWTETQVGIINVTDETETRAEAYQTGTLKQTEGDIWTGNYTGTQPYPKAIKGRQTNKQRDREKGTYKENETGKPSHTTNTGRQKHTQTEGKETGINRDTYKETNKQRNTEPRPEASEVEAWTERKTDTDRETDTQPNRQQPPDPVTATYRQPDTGIQQDTPTRPDLPTAEAWSGRQTYTDTDKQQPPPYPETATYRQQGTNTQQNTDTYRHQNTDTYTQQPPELPRAEAWSGRQTDTNTDRQPPDPETATASPQITWGRPNTHKAHFDPNSPKQVSVIVGHKTRLPCTVLDLDTRDVSWIRQRDLHIMSVGIFTYTRDDRFQVFHPEGSTDWHLDISSATYRDAGVYECQVSTSPKISMPITLSVQEQAAKIEGPRELFIQEGSTIRLRCEVKAQDQSAPALTWHRDGTILDYDSPRGGVSVEIEKTPRRTTSKLFLTRATKGDSGNYTCDPHTTEDPAVVLVHVVTGEESAAVHKASAVRVSCHTQLLLLLSLLSLLCCSNR